MILPFPGTVRRFMEQYSDSLTCIIFVLEPCDLGIYEVLLPLYFPRNLAEQDNACWQLPNDIGGTDGEPLLPDRQIRIIDNPQHALHGNGTFRCNYIRGFKRYSFEKHIARLQATKQWNFRHNWKLRSISASMPLRKCRVIWTDRDFWERDLLPIH